MIDLTPLEVRQKKGDFRRGMRGYDAELVNDFLDLVADRMEELVKENMALSDQVEALEEELVEYREKEAALSDALMTAQKLREDARGHAEKEGELMVREARAEAEAARHKVSRSLAAEEETLRQVRARRAQLVESFRRLLEREISELAVIEEALELESQPPESAVVVEPAVEDVAAERADDAGSPEEEMAQGSPAEELDSEAGVEEAAGVGMDETMPDEEDESSGEVQEDWLQSLGKE